MLMLKFAANYAATVHDMLDWHHRFEHLGRGSVQDVPPVRQIGTPVVWI